MMMQAPEMQEGANNAKNEERDATAARMVALRAKVAAKQLEEKQAAAKAREAARMEELRAKFPDQDFIFLLPCNVRVKPITIEGAVSTPPHV